MNINSKSFRIVPASYAYELKDRHVFYTLRNRVKEFRWRMYHPHITRGSMDNYCIGYFEGLELKKRLTLQEAERIIKLEEL